VLKTLCAATGAAVIDAGGTVTIGYATATAAAGTTAATVRLVPSAA